VQSHRNVHSTIKKTAALAGGGFLGQHVLHCLVLWLIQNLLARCFIDHQFKPHGVKHSKRSGQRQAKNPSKVPYCDNLPSFSFHKKTPYAVTHTVFFSPT